MCGIAGVIHLDGSPVTPAGQGAVLKAMGDRIAHRGPDDEQFLYWENVGFVFRRLSIVDLGGGRQPLRNGDGSLVLMVNGEIYNHRDLLGVLRERPRLRTRSDCEILIPLYEQFGLGFVDHLNGMFGAALLDKRNKRVVLVRDRLGIKPLYYYRDARRLVFASEIKALLAHPDVPREFDWQQGLLTQTFMNLPQPERPPSSLFKQVEYLPGGRMVVVDLASGKTDRRTYWDPRDSLARAEPMTREYAVERYLELLADAVRLRLMADVEFGLFLSGGIDSVAVAYLAALHRQDFHTFSVLGQSTLTNGDAPYAHRFSRNLGLVNHQVLFDWRDLDVSPDDWRRILWMCETPLAGPEQLYKYYLHAFARQERPGLKVMLLGQGSDDFNGGYVKRWFADPSQANWPGLIEMLQNRARQSTLFKTGGWSAYLPVGAGGRSVLNDRFLAEVNDGVYYEYPWHAYWDIYRFNLQTYQLWHEDRTSAAHSIENRVPFLDHRIVEHLWGIPRELHESCFFDKAILRDAMRGKLGAQFCNREKVPFFYGEDTRYTRRMEYDLWRRDGDSLIEQALAASEQDGGVLDADVVRAVVDSMPQDPEYTASEGLFRLLNMALLSSMARQGEPAPNANPVLPVAEVRIDDWNTWHERFGVGLIRRLPGLGADSVVRFGRGVVFVQRLGGAPPIELGSDYYLLVNNVLEFFLEPELTPWIRFLGQVDGIKTVADIIAAAGLDRDSVWKHLEEAVEQGVLVVAGRRDPSPRPAEGQQASPE